MPRPKPKFRMKQRVAIRMFDDVGVFGEVVGRAWDGDRFVYAITRQPYVTFREYELRPLTVRERGPNPERKVKRGK